MGRGSCMFYALPYPLLSGVPGASRCTDGNPEGLGGANPAGLSVANRYLLAALQSGVPGAARDTDRSLYPPSCALIGSAWLRCHRAALLIIHNS